MVESAFGFHQKMKKFHMHLLLSLAKVQRSVYIIVWAEKCCIFIGWFILNSYLSSIFKPIKARHQKNLVWWKGKRLQRRTDWISESTQGTFPTSCYPAQLLRSPLAISGSFSITFELTFDWLNLEMIKSITSMKIWPIWHIFPNQQFCIICASVIPVSWSILILVSSASPSIHIKCFQYTTPSLWPLTKENVDLRFHHIFSPSPITPIPTCW